jgi:hypothetical protein
MKVIKSLIVPYSVRQKIDYSEKITKVECNKNCECYCSRGKITFLNNSIHVFNTINQFMEYDRTKMGLPPVPSAVVSLLKSFCKM